MGCNLLYVQHLLGKRWALLVLEELNYSGQASFNDLSSKLDSITNKQLSERLYDLTLNNLIDKKILSEKPLRVQYKLTGKGKDLLDVFGMMKEWAVKHKIVEEYCIETNCNGCSTLGNHKSNLTM